MKDLSVDLSQVELWILKSLSAGRHRYGLEIRDAIEELFGRKISFSSLYPKLELLDAKGLIEIKEGNTSIEDAGRKRRYFAITNTGKSILEKWEDAYSDLAIFASN